MEYIDFLYDQVKRLEKIERYYIRSEKAKKDKERDYYREGMQMLFSKGENFDNFQEILDEYRKAIITRQDVKQKLYNEIDIIKKLRV